MIFQPFPDSQSWTAWTALNFSCLERIQLVLEQLDELEPEDMDSDAYEDWGERHEALEDLADELQDRLDELE